ncbi:MAG: anthranilate phosphoribosyltransferase [Akkermansiaceae bacterium]
MDFLIQQLEAKQDLAQREIEIAAEFLLDQSASAEKKARLLELLAVKGETPAEIAGFVEVFLARAVDPQIHLLDLNGPTLDLCGTGGDQLHLFNVSTTTMFIAAAAGAVVVKHGNRGITSKSGGADVLEALGVKLDLSTDDFRHCLDKAGVGFLFAPSYHPAFKAVVDARKMLGARKVRTIFNLIGPLLNPARPQCQLVGVYEKSLCPVFAEILQRLGRKSAWAVHGSTQTGTAVDEVSLMGPTWICKSGISQNPENKEITPHDFGLSMVDVVDLQGGDAHENAKILEAILSGAETGPKRDMVLLNAAAAITCAGLTAQISDGLEIARQTIIDGSAIEKLRLLQRYAK